MAERQLCCIYDTDDEGTVSLTMIKAGRHRGGVSHYRQSWTGGLSPEIAADLTEAIKLWILAGVEDGLQERLL